MKEYFTLGYHVGRIKEILDPDYKMVYDKAKTDREIFLYGGKLFFYIFFLYVFMYFLVFLLGFSYFAEWNQSIRIDFEKKGFSSLSLFFNSYPWNIIFVLATLLIFLLFTSILSYLVVRVLEDQKRSFRAHLGLCLHSLSILVTSLFFIYIANTLFPFHQEVGVVLFSFLIAFWIIVFGLAVYISTKVFVRISESYFDQQTRRAALTWLLPLYLVFSSIFGFITGN